MVIFEGSISHKHFHHQMDADYNANYEDLQIAFAKGAAFIMPTAANLGSWKSAWP